MFGAIRWRAGLVVVFAATALFLLPNLSLGIGDDTRTNTDEFESPRYYNLPIATRQGICRKLKAPTLLRDFSGKVLSQKTGASLYSENRAIPQRKRRYCTGDSKGARNGVLFQPYEALDSPFGSLNYSFGWDCIRYVGPGKCVPGTKKTGQSGSMAADMIDGDEIELNPDGSPACVQQKISEGVQKRCDGEHADDIYAMDNTNLSDTPKQGNYRSFVYRVKPARIPRAMGFFGVSVPDLFRSATEYGFASPLSSTHKNILWNLFDQEGGGVARAMVKKDTLFHRAAVDAVHLPSKNKRTGAVNGGFTFYYGYVQNTVPVSSPSGIAYYSRIYGWILAGSKLNGHAPIKQLKVVHPDSETPEGPVTKFIPDFLNSEAVADGGNLLPEAQLEEDLNSIPTVDVPEGSDGYACVSCNSLGKTEPGGEDSRIVGDVNGDGEDDVVGVTEGSWTIATSHQGKLSGKRTWASEFGATNEDQFLGDVDADGDADAITVDPDSGNWKIARSDQSSFGSPELWKTGLAPGSRWSFAEDVTGDGRVDAVSLDVAGNWYVAPSGGDSFSGAVIRWISGFGDADSLPLLGDVNGDGAVDAISLHQPTGDWRVALSTRRGFAAPTVWAENQGAGSASAFVGDVTGDGRADAVWAAGDFSSWNVGEAQISSFAPADRWLGKFGTLDDDFFLGDTNGDGLQDAMISHDQGDWESALSTGAAFDGYGSWLGSSSDVDAIAATASVTGDVNGDGKADAVWIGADDKLRAGISDANQFVRNDDAWVEELDAGGSIYSGQLDDAGSGDSADDVVVTDADGDWHVFKGDDGGFADEGDQLPAFAGDANFLADVDGDGDADGIKVDGAGGWAVAIRDDGEFEAPTVWMSTFGASTHTKLVGDVDGDGKVDAIAVNTTTGEWLVAKSTGSGFDSPTTWADGYGAGSLRQMVGDLNGDGKADAVYVSKYKANWFVAESNGVDGFETPSRLMTIAGVGSDNQMLADVNGDAVLDAVAVYEDKNLWFANTDTTKSIEADSPEAGGFEDSSNWLGAADGAGRALSGDVDGDGRDDAISFDTYDGTVRVATSDGSPPGTFGGGDSYVTWATGANTNFESALLGDFNGDGKDDFATISPTQFDWFDLRFRTTWDVWISDGESFVEDDEMFLPTADFDSYKFRDFAADVNGDGTSDAIHIDQTGDVYVALSNGASFLPSTLWFDNYAESPSDGNLDPQHLSVVGDFDGDGKADLAASPDEGVWWVLRSQGNRFEPEDDPLTSSLSSENRLTLAGDATGDGRADLVSVDQAEGSWSVSSSEDEYEEEPAIWLLSLGSDDDQPLLGDVNGDGQKDAINYAPGSPTVANWSVATAKRTPPTTEIQSGPSNGDDVKPADVAWTFSSARGESFECSIDDTSWSACDSPHSAPSLSDGAHSFAVRSLSGGVAERHPPRVTFHVDSVTPETTITSGPTGGATISNGSAEFEFESTDSSARFYCRMDAESVVPCRSPLAVAVLDGSHTFTVVARDGAGNEDLTAATASFSVSGGSAAVDTEITNGPDPITTDPDAEFEFSAVGNDSFECRVDGGTWSECDSPFTLTLPRLISDDHAFEVRSVTNGFPDPTPDTYEWHADLEPPIVTIASPQIGENLESGSVDIAFTSSQSIEDSLCALDDGSPEPCETSDTLSLNSSGWHVLTISVENAAGNIGTATVAFQLMGNLETNIFSGPEGSIAGEYATFEFQSSNEAATFECKTDAAAWAECESPFEIALNSLTDGNHVFSARSVVAGVRDVNAAVSAFVLDTDPPSPPEISVENPVTADATPLFSIAPGDTAEQIASLECSVGVLEFEECTRNWETSDLADGIHTVTARAVDLAGNRSDPATATVTVDTIAPDAPAIDSPVSPSSDVAPDFVVSPAEPSGILECRATATTTYQAIADGHFSPTFASDGAKIIECRQTDAAGNIGSIGTATYVLSTSSVAVSGGVLTFTSGLNQNNTLTISQASGTYTFSDTSAIVNPGPGCSSDNANQVSCASALITSLDVLGLDGNDTIEATTTTPATIHGGDGDDVLTGGTGTDSLTGGDGNDTVDYSNAGSAVSMDLSTTTEQATGGAGSDTVSTVEHVIGSAFNDVLVGSSAANELHGGDGNDALQGLGGNDTLSGGAGVDTLRYSNSPSAVTVNLATTTAQNTGGAGTDTITNAENLIGSAYNDTLTGDAADNVIDGQAGNDAIDGASGSSDHVDYSAATAGVTVNLSTASAQNTGGAGTDTITNVENVIGSAYNDSMTGTAATNILSAGNGHDTLNGLAGDDVLDGGSGRDGIYYSSATSAVTVNLATTTAQNTGGAGTDTITNVENAFGSAYNDSLTGDAADNIFDGRAGDDAINGASGGADQITYSTATSAVTVNLATTTAQNTGGAGTDTLTSVENVTGSPFNDTLAGTSAINELYGGDGNDALQGLGGNDLVSGGNGDDVLDPGTGGDVVSGGSGIDTADYSSRTAAINLTMTDSADDGETGENDNVASDVENGLGGSGNDVLLGNDLANMLSGGAGNDTITGGDGADSVFGGSGSDSLALRDLTPDTADCGTDTDNVTADPSDFAGLIGCETVTFP